MRTISRLIFPLILIITLHLPLYSVNSSTQPPTADSDKIIFTPPSGWRNAEKSALPKQVKLMVIGKGPNEFPPSISIATETYSGSLKDYLKIVKQINSSKGQIWKDLGNLRTEAGNASLSQTDSQSEWGNIRMMHVILKKNGTVYIITAAALKDEFPKFYKEIFTTLRSLRFDTSP
jgi:hypothetical protein